MTLDAQLRSLDAASGQPNARQRARGASLVERIVNTDTVSPRRSRSSIAWRAGALLGAGALVATGAILLPGITPAPRAVAS